MILAGSRLGVEAPVTFCENPDLLHKDIGYIYIYKGFTGYCSTPNQLHIFAYLLVTQ